MGSFRNASVTIRRQTLKCFLRIRIEYYHAFRSRFPTMCGELVTFQHIIYRIYQSVYMYAVVWLMAPFLKKPRSIHSPRCDRVPNHPLGYVGIFHAVERMGLDWARLSARPALGRSRIRPILWHLHLFIVRMHINLGILKYSAESLRVSLGLSCT